MGRLLSELLGTFALVFVGTGAIIVNDSYGGVVTHVGVALAFGMVVTAMIYALGDVSGAHINPAVSLGFGLAGRLAPKWVVAYMAAQLAGALAASGVLRWSFPGHPNLGSTVPTVSLPVAFVFEAVLTAMLMSVILHVAIGYRERGLLAGVAIGAMVSLAALFAGPVTGASLNPARSLAPALVSRTWDDQWIYLTAPFLGSALALLAWRLIRPPQAQSA